jgi:hypothetical protein
MQLLGIRAGGKRRAVEVKHQMPGGIHREAGVEWVAHCLTVTASDSVLSLL